MLRRSLITPSYVQGFARSQGEAQHPGLWPDGGAWIPSLGPSGATLYDVSGYGVNGTLVNRDPGTDWVIGENGYALNFDGIDGYADLTRPSLINLGTIWSVVISTDWDSAVGVGNKHAFDGRGAGSEVLAFRYAANDVFIRDSGGTFTTLSITFAEGPHQYAVVSDGIDSITYNDGVESDRANTVIDLVSMQNISIGAQFAQSEWGGLIDFIYIYNRALSPAEITQLYADSLAPFRLRDRRAFVAVPAVGFIPYPHPILPEMQGGLVA